MVRYEYLIAPHTAGMLAHLIYDYGLPIDITICEMVVVPELGHRKKSTLRKISVTLDESDMEILEAALLILGLS